LETRFSESRSGYVNIIIQLVYLFFFHRRSDDDLERRRRRRSFDLLPSQNHGVPSLQRHLGVQGRGRYRRTRRSVPRFEHDHHVVDEQPVE
jgi:hypothetical protein